MPIVEHVLNLAGNLASRAKDDAAALDRLSASMAASEVGATKAGSAAVSLGSGLATIAAPAAAAAASITAAAAAVAAMTQKTADLRNQLTQMSGQTGLSVETLSGLRYAASTASRDFKEFESALAQLPKRILDVSRGTGEALVAFQRMGVEVAGVDGHLRTTDDIFAEVIGKLQTWPNATERAAMATLVFGDAGTKLAASLGDVPLEQFINRARTIGTDVGPEAVANAKEWQVKVTDLNLAYEHLLGTLSDEAGMGAYIDKVTALLGVLDKWVVKIGEVGGAYKHWFETILNTTQLPYILAMKGHEAFASMVGLPSLTDGAAGVAAGRGGPKAGEGTGELLYRDNWRPDTAGTGAMLLFDGKGAKSGAAGKPSPGDAWAAAQDYAGTWYSGPKIPMGAGYRAFDPSSTRVDFGAPEFTLSPAAMPDDTYAGLDALKRVGSKVGGGLLAGLGGASSLLTGGLGALGGPAGMAIGAIQTLGQPGAVKEGMDALIKQVQDLPKLLSHLVEKGIPTLIANIPDLILALLESLPQMLMSIVVELPLAIARAIVEAIFPGKKDETPWGGKGYKKSREGMTPYDDPRDDVTTPGMDYRGGVNAGSHARMSRGQTLVNIGRIDVSGAMREAEVRQIADTLRHVLGGNHLNDSLTPGG